MKNGGSYKGSKPGTNGAMAGNTMAGTNTGKTTSVKQGAGQGQGTTGPISHKNPFPNGMA